MLDSKLEIHPAAGVFILTDENHPRTLLVKHKKIGVWFQPGGHQENTETILETAIRETREETGIDLTEYLPKPTQIDKAVVSLPLPRYILMENIPQYKETPAHIHQDSTYVVRIPYKKIVRAEVEHDDIGWFRKDELGDLELLENTRKLLFEIFASVNSV